MILLLVVENRESVALEYSKLLVDLAWNRIVNTVFWRGPFRAVWWTRRTMIEYFLNSPDFKDYTHVLFLDTDVIPEDEGFVARLKAHEADMVSGYYCTTDGKPVNVKDGKKGYVGKGVEEVDVFSMGFSLISRKVLENVPYPQPDPVEKMDADVEFCRAAKEKGYTVLQDFNLKGTHILRSAF